MKPCVCCNNPAEHWVTIKDEKKFINFHLSKSIKSEIVEENSVRLHLVFVCDICQRFVKEGKSIKELKYSNLLHKAANIAFTV